MPLRHQGVAVVLVVGDGEARAWRRQAATLQRNNPRAATTIGALADASAGLRTGAVLEILNLLVALQNLANVVLHDPQHLVDLLLRLPHLVVPLAAPASREAGGPAGSETPARAASGRRSGASQQIARQEVDGGRGEETR